MKTFNLGVFAIALALSAGTLAQAGTVSFAGDVGVQPPGKTSGVIQVLIDLEPGQSMQNGGIVMGVSSSGADAISFESAAVDNTGNRWTLSDAAVTPGTVDFSTSSFFSPALPAGGQDVMFATINWVKTGNGRSDLSFRIGAEAFVDGNNGDVTSAYVGEANFVSFIPEPSSLSLVGLSLIGLVLRRRNG